MAISDLIIRPRVGGLRYASGVMDEMRLIFQDLESASFDPKKVRQIAKRAKGRAISAKATIDYAIKDAIAMEAAKAGETETGSTRSATARASSEASPGKDNHA